MPPATALIIDDDELLLVRCADMLRAAGMAVRIAGGVPAAARALDDSEFDVVVAGIRVRESSAAELLRTIRSHDEELPVIFVSTWPDFDEVTSRDALRGTVISAAVGYQRSRRR